MGGKDGGLERLRSLLSPLAHVRNPWWQCAEGRVVSAWKIKDCILQPEILGNTKVNTIRSCFATPKGKRALPDRLAIIGYIELASVL